jgi:signal transduction histidine kinase
MKMLYHSLDLNFPADDPRAKDAQIMGEKIEHLNKIVERILDFARTSEPQFVAVNLSELIEELGLLTRHKLTQQNIQVVHRFEPNLPSIMADATQLEQAFLNLILNAVEAMPAGGRLTISSGAALENKRPTHVFVEFKDTGHGMTKEERARAFASLLKTTKTKGTGLGLAIVARTVEAHRGRVEIKSRSGRGTAIRIVLPL